ncbi:chemotaxis protein CheW [Candidatus Endoriftia persephone]|jgi:chemosensory pili system protein ChpC|uniref:Chemotaxis protein CheW n=2 Tax=Gammaproteobacteria TaxID=1236 RepID=A0A9J6ZZD2_9GAMM|nr:chemotaxis protein CheW [Candidatus Endoriftia persephone]EGV50195.1 putative chemotaxis protein [endosymbiont of Riftia pachyptila (vent Ph05)]USF88243.1 chemotaxis protein CheW [Candidatus Endoriftia persephone]
MSEAIAGEVRSVLIPLVSGRLLLPNAVVAEVAAYQQAEPLDDAPAWLRGIVEWRRIKIPLIAFEGMLEEEWIREPGNRGRIAVVHTLNGDASLPCFGVVCQSVPSLVRITTENIMPSESDGEISPVVQKSVLVNGETAMIPDLDEVEFMLLEAFETK